MSNERAGVMHPSDLSKESVPAFEHALRIALSARAPLRLLHVENVAPEEARWQDFPAVRKTLERWSFLEPGSARRAVLDELGVAVSKVAVQGRDPAKTIMRYLQRREIELIVLATQGREGAPRWLHPSVAEPVARAAARPALFVRGDTPGFVSPDDGRVSLRRVLIAVDHDPHAGTAVDTTVRLLELLEQQPEEIRLLHVGDVGSMPELQTPHDDWPWTRSVGDDPVVDAILGAAEGASMDLIVMATRGRQGFLDALRGTTTEQVIRRAPCPVLAVPSED